MQQQPILTADEVIELLKREALPDDEELQEIFDEVVKETKLVLGKVDNFYATLPLLKHFEEFLQKKGIHVYLEIIYPFGFFKFIAGECARVYEEMCKLEEYITNLIDFILDNKEILSPEVAAAEERRLTDYQNRLCDEVIFPLEDAYADSDKEAIKALLEKAQKVKEEIYEGIKDLERAYTLATTL
jgi:hypothetical protein